jgi:hypothetical protein
MYTITSGKIAGLNGCVRSEVIHRQDYIERAQSRKQRHLYSINDGKFLDPVAGTRPRATSPSDARLHFAVKFDTIGNCSCV